MVEASLTDQLQKAIGEDKSIFEGSEQEPVVAEEQQELSAEAEELEDAELDEEAAEGEETEEEIRSIADLAKVNGWDVDELYALEVAMPDGEQPLKLGEVKNAVIEERRKAAQLEKQAQEQQALLAQTQQYAQQATQQDARVHQLATQMQMIDVYLNSQELKAIEQQDPGRAAALMARANQQKQKLAGEQQQIYAQSQQAQTQMRQMELQRGAQYLHEHIPEWRDEKVAATEKREIAEAMQAAGYNPQYVSQANNPLEIAAWRELLQYRKQAAGGKEALKQVQASPKRSLRAARMKQGTANQLKKSKLAARAKKTGRKQDILAAARAITGARK